MIKFYRILFLLSLAVFPGSIWAQGPSSYATKLFEYKPAPGQFTNDGFGTPDDAQGVLKHSDNGMVSLGGFGGYVVVGFDQPVNNDPRNPYGVDFTVIANGFQGWAEPGAVMVMEDVNDNGRPDDTWYELAGSHYHFRDSKNVNVTYVNPRYDTARDVPWQTDLGENGVLQINEFHHQPYYPQPGIFNNVNADRETYTGRRINIPIDRAYPFYIKSPGLAFGYADNKLNNDNPTVPRNPYYDDENGQSADGFDISWAVDASGNPVTLSKIDFVKIYNPVQADAGWLGEISTEVECIAITTPDDSWVPQDYWLHVIGAAPLQIEKGKGYAFEGMLFKNGIPQQTPGSWSVSDESIGTIDPQGNFTAVSEGEVTIQYLADARATPANYTVYVVSLIDLEVSTNNPAVFVGEQTYIYTEGITNREEPDTHFAYDAYTYAVSDPSRAEISSSGVFTAKAPGKVTVTVTPVAKPSLSGTINIAITAPSIKFATGADHLSYPEGVENKRIDLLSIFSVAHKGQLLVSLKSNTNTALVEATVEDYRYLNLSFDPHKAGDITLMLEFTAYCQVTELPLTITVVLNHAPVVLHAISNVSVTQGSPDQVISLANTFGDDDNDVSQMVLSVVGNTNDALVTTAMAGNDLTLSFAPALAGQAEITVEALSGGKSVTTSFTVTVSPVTEPPVTGIGEEPLLTRLYPNPATTWLTLELAETRGSTIALRNALGTTVYQSQTHDQEVNINLQELPAGVYFLSVSTADHTVTQKIIH